MVKSTLIATTLLVMMATGATAGNYSTGVQIGNKPTAAQQAFRDDQLRIRYQGGYAHEREKRSGWTSIMKTSESDRVPSRHHQLNEYQRSSIVDYGEERLAGRLVYRPDPNGTKYSRIQMIQMPDGTYVSAGPNARRCSALFTPCSKVGKLGGEIIGVLAGALLRHAF